MVKGFHFSNRLIRAQTTPLWSGPWLGTMYILRLNRGGRRGLAKFWPKEGRCEFGIDRGKGGPKVRKFRKRHIYMPPYSGYICTFLKVASLHRWKYWIWLLVQELPLPLDDEGPASHLRRYLPDGHDPVPEQFLPNSSGNGQELLFVRRKSLSREIVAPTLVRRCRVHREVANRHLVRLSWIISRWMVEIWIPCCHAILSS